MLWYILTIYLVFINIISLIVTVADKICAIRRKERVSENLLMFISAIGGAFLMYVTMKCINHKTRKKKFMIGIPLILTLQVLVFTLIYIYF